MHDDNPDQNEEPKKTGLEKLKDAFDENPLLVIGVISGATIAAAKLIDALTTARNSRTWKKEVERRARKNKHDR